MTNLTAAEVFRDYVTDGVPSSGKNKVKKADARTLFTGYEQIINAFTSTGGLIYASKSAMDADLAHDANAQAWVIGDPVVANNGVYGKIGASGSGSWTRRADLPYSFLLASNAGAGTPNAIVATTSIPVSSSTLILLQIAEDYTGTSATVSFNGGASLAIKTNSGEDVLALSAGSVVYGVISGSTFRLASDEAIASLIYAARDDAIAARDAAEGYKDDAQAALATMTGLVDGQFPSVQYFAVGGATQTMDLGNTSIPAAAIKIIIDGVFQFDNTWSIADGVVSPVGDTWPGDGVRTNAMVIVWQNSEISVSEAVPLNESVSSSKLDQTLKNLVERIETGGFPATRTEMAAMDLDGVITCYLCEDGRQGFFDVKNWDDYSTVAAIDTLGGYVVRSTSDPTKCFVRDVRDGLRIEHFGAKAYRTEAEMATAQTSGAQINVAWKVARSLGAKLQAGAGYFRCETQLYFSCARHYSSFIGTPECATRLWFRSDTVASPNLFIYYDPAEAGDADNGFFYRFQGFRVESDLIGTAVQIGKATADGQGYDINNSYFRFISVNYRDHASARTLISRWTFSSLFDQMTLNGGGKDTPENPHTHFNIWDVYGMEFCKINKPSIGNGYLGIAFISPTYNVGNQIDTPDFEELNYCVESQSVNTIGLTIKDGQFVWNTYCWRNTAGSNILMDNPNLATSNLASNIFDPTYGQGAVRIRGGRLAVSTPAVPSSGTWVTNSTGSRVLVRIYGGTSVSIWRPDAAAGNSMTGNAEVLLDVGEQIRIDYTDAPTWVWKAWE